MNRTQKIVFILAFCFFPIFLKAQNLEAKKEFSERYLLPKGEIIKFDYSDKGQNFYLANIGEYLSDEERFYGLTYVKSLIMKDKRVIKIVDNAQTHIVNIACASSISIHELISAIQTARADYYKLKMTYPNPYSEIETRLSKLTN